MIQTNPGNVFQGQVNGCHKLGWQPALRRCGAGSSSPGSGGRYPDIVGGTTQDLAVSETDGTVSIELNFKAFADNVPTTQHAKRTSRL
jgi:hypothetical protein